MTQTFHLFLSYYLFLCFTVSSSDVLWIFWYLSYLISLNFLNLWMTSFISLEKFLAIAISTVVSLFILFSASGSLTRQLMWLILSSFLNVYHFLSLILFKNSRSVMSNLCWIHSLKIHFNFKSLVFCIHESLFSVFDCFWVYFIVSGSLHIFKSFKYIKGIYFIFYVSNLSIWNLCKVHSVASCFSPLALRIMFFFCCIIFD